MEDTVEFSPKLMDSWEARVAQIPSDANIVKLAHWSSVKNTADWENPYLVKFNAPTRGLVCYAIHSRIIDSFLKHTHVVPLDQLTIFPMYGFKSIDTDSQWEGVCKPRTGGAVTISKHSEKVYTRPDMFPFLNKDTTYFRDKTLHDVIESLPEQTTSLVISLGNELVLNRFTKSSPKMVYFLDGFSRELGNITRFNSLSLIKELADESLDVLFIDEDDSDEAFLALVRPKLRKVGCFITKNPVHTLENVKLVGFSADGYNVLMSL